MLSPEQTGAHLSDNESPPGPRRPPEPFLTEADRTASLHHDRPVRVRSSDGAFGHRPASSLGFRFRILRASVWTLAVCGLFGEGAQAQSPSTDATLSGLALADADDNAISLTPAFAIATKNYTAAVANGVDEMTVTLAVNESNATVEYLDADDMGIDDADAVEDGQQVSLEVGANTIKVKVTAEDDSITETYTVVATRLPPTVVPADWSLIPDGLVAGDQFRLLFLSSTKFKPDSTDIVGYNTFAQGRAAAGHTDIQAYSPGFRVVGCTADDDARDNTATTYTIDDKGVAIYWLGVAKVAADYENFYDGDWDDQVNNKHRRMTFHHV